MSGGVHLSTPPLPPAVVRDRLEANLRAALALAPPTVGQITQAPIFGTFPQPGHTYPAPPSPAIGLTQSLFAR